METLAVNADARTTEDSSAVDHASPACNILKRQVAAYKLFTESLEKQLSHHSAKADEYRAAIETLESERQANAILTAERDELAVQVAKMRGACRNFIEHGYSQLAADIADEALALPDLSASTLNKVRSEALRQAADVCNVHAMMATNQDGAEWANSCETAIRELAADVEAGKQ